MIVRQIEPRDREQWAAMRIALWPEENAGELSHETGAHFAGKPLYPAVFVADAGEGVLLGFLELGLRPYAEGATESPVPHVEAWYVSASARRQGVGRALVAAAEAWAREHGHHEMTSDALVSNTVSRNAHAGVGFAEVEEVVCFRKPL